MVRAVIEGRLSMGGTGMPSGLCAGLRAGSRARSRAHSRERGSEALNGTACHGLADPVRGPWAALRLTAARAMVIGALVVAGVSGGLGPAGTSAFAQDDPFAEAEAEMLAAEEGTLPDEDDLQFEDDDVNDPFEDINRFFFRTNNALDKMLLKPLAMVYRSAIPGPLRNVTRNLVNNLQSPVILANDLFQLEFQRAATTTARFGINSIFGFFGAADLAGEMGLPRHSEDFGQTLGVYGVPEGPYLFLPALGPAPPRDLVGQIVDQLIDPITWLGGDVIAEGDFTLEWSNLNPIRGGLGIIDARARNIEALEDLEESSLDFYAAVRSLYRQSREGAIRNGRVDLEGLQEFEEFDEFDEFDE